MLTKVQPAPGSEFRPREGRVLFRGAPGERSSAARHPDSDQGGARTRGGDGAAGRIRRAEALRGWAGARAPRPAWLRGSPISVSFSWTVPPSQPPRSCPVISDVEDPELPIGRRGWAGPIRALDARNLGGAGWKAGRALAEGWMLAEGRDPELTAWRRGRGPQLGSGEWGRRMKNAAPRAPPPPPAPWAFLAVPGPARPFLVGPSCSPGLRGRPAGSSPDGRKRPWSGCVEPSRPPAPHHDQSHVFFPFFLSKLTG